ncbi:MAG: 2-dehydropantoate 2-reductase N-terminal domain-containing protein [Micrococcus sp.]|nr:2-dehydropantoate 2-reductase N-terminal domain-containing protein [Micrococcus sp.]
MKAVVIGAGRVGLGCAAVIAHQAGCEVVVLARGAVCARLAEHGAAVVHTVQGPRSAAVRVPVRAVDLQARRREAVQEIASADVVFTAVGPRQLPSLARLLAEGLGAAQRSVDVIALENAEDAGALLRCGVADVWAELPALQRHPHVRHGFSGAVVDRVVAQRLLSDAQSPVSVVTEEECRVIVDRTALVHDWSWMPGVHAVADFAAYFRAKLHCYSAGHATAAYLGMLKGYRFVHAAVADPEIAEAVRGVMEEGRQGLLHRYGPHVAGTEADIDRILHRFANAALRDTTRRVGQDVPRKLARHDRLTGPARGALRAGVSPENLAFTIAAALHVHVPVAPRAPRQRRRTIASLMGVKPSAPLVEMVHRHWTHLVHPAALLSLRVGLPAWEDTTVRI